MKPDKNRGRKRTIQPISITRFWHRRIAEVAAFVAAVIIVLFALPYVLGESPLTTLLSISYVSVGLASATLLASLVLYFVIPKRNLSLLTLFIYTLLAVTIGSIVIATGQSNSPLIGLWIGVCVFAGVFGWQGFALISLLVLGYDAYLLINQAPINAALVATAATVAPLIVSFIIWHSKSTKDAKQDKAYRELATELSHEANKSEAVINAINDGVIAVDTEGIIQLINPAAAQIIGWGQNDAIGLSYDSVIKLHDKADKPISTENNPISQVFATNQEVHSEDFSVSTESGKKILLSVVVSPLGHPATGAIMVFRDMTKERAEEREQAEFISTASHEMRTPVASIEGYLGLVLNPATATIDEKARDYVQKAQASAQHLGRLFQDLLDVSKADDGRLNNNPKVIDVAAFVGDIVEGLKPKAIEKNLGFVYQPAVDDTAAGDRKLMPVYYVHVDGDHLREVTANLVENAIKYTLAGNVTVNITGDDSHVTVSIQDSGIGIPAEDIPHLFQKFYRVDNSDTREIGGTGLGLYLCRRLAEVMGGRMTVVSEYKKGSTFSLVLPRIDSSEANKLLEASADTKKQSQQNQASPQVMTPNSIETPSAENPPQAAPTPIINAPQPAIQQQPAQLTLSTTPIRPGQDILPRRPATPQAPNIPLTQLEQNPSAYTAQRPGVQVPNRNNQP